MELFLILKGPCRLEGGNLTPIPIPTPHPSCRSQTQLPSLQLFPPQIRHPFGEQCSLVNHLME